MCCAIVLYSAKNSSIMFTFLDDFSFSQYNNESFNVIYHLHCRCCCRCHHLGYYHLILQGCVPGL